MAEEIVISGLSGRFPESGSITEFAENLYNKVDLLTDDDRRWEPGLYGLPHRLGKLKDLSRFDSQFFGVHHKQAHLLDPQARILLELTYESILDAGYDPEELRSRNIGVFIGCCSSESDEFFTYDHKKINGYAMTGCSRSMFANRISYTYDFKGPSFVMDSACSSGALALYEAVKAIQNGECEAAIVGGANLCLRPGTSLQFYKLNMLSDDGTCKSFDAEGKGYGRSEAIVSLFLQKSNVARRKYASIIHVKTNTDGFKDQGVTFPSSDMQKRLINEVYKECQLDPLEISYVEAHGTGTPAGDPIEMSAISDIFCEGRQGPLLVGSVKSNMGHSEPTSGLCSVAKVLIGMEKGLIPPNLHFKTPNPNISALLNGRVQIVTEPTPWRGGYAALSCFGFGGVNVHAVLKSNENDSLINQSSTKSVIPQLAVYAGRTEESVQYMFDQLSLNPAPREFFALLHRSSYASCLMKPFRGYKLLTDDDQDVVGIKQVSNDKRQLWYIFSGMGTQWPCMAKQLMNLEVFAKSIYKSAEVLKPYGLDLIDLVTNGVKDKTNTRSIIPAFVSIAAVQVALVDVLDTLGLKPDGLVGHSVGELGCAYADGSFTAEQMVLAAYWRGKAVEEANLEQGAMAALGLTWSQANTCCPKDIFPSCHNAEDSVTISGPQSSVKDFVEKLKAENVFAREVDSCGYAFHSQYIFPAAGRLQEALEKVIPDPKPRGSRWISSSYRESEWEDPSAKFAGAAYFVHNLVSPVLFHEALHHVPKDAVVVEIAPHHLLQAILKRVIGSEAEYIGLMKRNVDNTVHLLSSIGRLYASGHNPDIEKLYPEVSFPVPRNTPMIAPLIKWDHSDSWTVAKWDKNTNQSRMVTEVNVGPEDSSDHYILGHCIDGRCLYPATGYLMLVWKAFADIKGKDFENLPVGFEGVEIHRATVMSKTNTTRFLVDITNTGGEFEISEGGMTVCTGKIYSPDGESNFSFDNTKTSMPMVMEDIYKELRLRGYDYGKSFQGIAAADLEGEHGLLTWNGNWVVFLDTMLQFSILGSHKRALSLPTRFQNVQINPIIHAKVVAENLEKHAGVSIYHNKKTRQCFAAGVSIKNLKASIAPRNQSRQIPVLEEYSFVPYNEICELAPLQQEALDRYVHVCSSVAKMILELSGKSKDQISDVMNGFKEADETLVANYIKSYAEDHVLLKSLCGIMNTATSKDLTRHVKSFVGNYLLERENDIISHTLVKESPLRMVLDVALENLPSRNLKFAEASNGLEPLCKKLNEFLQSQTTLHVKYAVAHSQPDMIGNENIPSTFDISAWDLKADFKFKDLDLFALKYLNCSKEEYGDILSNAAKAVRDDGFLIVLQRTKLVPAEMFLSAVGETVIPFYPEVEVEKIFKELDLQIVCKKNDSVASTLYLLRKNGKSSYQDEIVPITEGKYDAWVDAVKEKMTQASQSQDQRIWLVSEGEESNGILGLVNCLRQEPGGLSIRCLFTGKTLSKFPEFRVDNPFYEDIFSKNLTMNVYKKGTWGSYRHLNLPEDLNTVETEHAYLNVMTRGDLSSFMWVDSSLKYFSSTPESDNVLCHVYYAPLNFRDVMLASGKLPPDAIPGDLALQDCILGLEFSGRLANGHRVMGLVPAKGLATTVTADRHFVWDVPESWTLEQASTVPVAYSTAYYALVLRGHLRQGDRVLIHSGSGGVGQAAIAIALSYGCEVYTTVGSSEKREFLKKRFSQLEDRNFCNSRDTSFEQYILQATNGEGVDVILNSLADEKLKATLNCLAQHGRFLEIGKYDLSNNSPLGMALFLKNISFHGILLDALFEKTSYSARIKKEVVRLVSEGIADGTVKPLNSIVYDHDQAEQAFRFMASGKHIGKVVLKVKEEEEQQIVKPVPTLFTAVSRTTCDPDKSYVIVGGLGGFGLELCEWLAERGARHIILTSRSGIKSGYQKFCMNRWKKESLNIIVSKLDVTKKDEAESLLKLADSQAPVGGIFNLALVLRDAFMENQTAEMYQAVCDSKVNSTQYLDTLSRKHCPSLQWFVCFSSVSCGRGNAGQSNYGFANSVMERICEERSHQGLPGLAIQWGAIGDVGVIQDTVGSDVVIGGTVPQRITSCLSVLDKFLQQSLPVVSSFIPYQPSNSSGQKSSKQNVLSTLANIFGIKDIASINEEITLGELGMDSLMGVELKQFFERDFEIVLSVPELRQMKVKDLKDLEGSQQSAPSESKTTPEFNVIPSFFSSLQTEQLVPTETIIRLNKVQKGVPMFIVHPIEGTAVMLQALADLLPMPVYGIQCTKDAPMDSVESLAAFYWKHVISTSKDQSIHLAGYSFGASVAYEMMSLAERNPKDYPGVEKVVFLDGSPCLASVYTRDHSSHFMVDSQVEGEAQALCSFALQFMQLDMIQLKSELLALPSYEERLQFAARHVQSSQSHLRVEDLHDAADLYYHKLLISLGYVPQHRLQHPLTLVKAARSIDITEHFSEKYDLEKVCDSEVTVHTTEGTHVTFIQGKGAEDISHIVCKMLSM